MTNHKNTCKACTCISGTLSPASYYGKLIPLDERIIKLARKPIALPSLAFANVQSTASKLSSGHPSYFPYEFTFTRFFNFVFSLATFRLNKIEFKVFDKRKVPKSLLPFFLCHVTHKIMDRVFIFTFFHNLAPCYPSAYAARNFKSIREDFTTAELYLPLAGIDTLSATKILFIVGVGTYNIAGALPAILLLL